MLNLTETLRVAQQFHQAGDLTQAEQLYRQILQSYPNNADTYFLLGAVAHQTGRHEQAVALMRQAVALNPSAATYRCNLGLALATVGRFSGDWDGVFTRMADELQAKIAGCAFQQDKLP